MLRLDPSHPPLWRDPTTLQFGIDAVAVLDDPQPWQERIVRELEDGFPDAALGPLAESFGAPPGGAAAMIDRIGAAFEIVGTTPVRVGVVGVDGIDPAIVDAVAEALVAADHPVTVLDDVVSEPALAGLDDVVIVAHHVVHPRHGGPRARRPAAPADRLLGSPHPGRSEGRSRPHRVPRVRRRAPARRRPGLAGPRHAADRGARAARHARRRVGGRPRGGTAAQRDRGCRYRSAVADAARAVGPAAGADAPPAS
ncbi:hypothetical protein AB1K54_04275 [Microbacterium sp. BWT-B31]|uniref:hypothetical protein n=1 Tax=Microbacterium sp. BWT-B31 TaxID=3232072 RepID=UPI003527922A